MTEAFPRKFLFCLLVGLLFGLPHLVRIAVLGSFRDYTPFSAQSPSPTVYDETYMYAAQANYMLQQHRLANDTDAFEHRNEPFPYSILPAEVEIGLSQLTGGLGSAQILSHFLFPAITAWLLMDLLLRLQASTPLGALLTLLILVFAFSARTVLLGNLALITHGLHSNFFETLQAARNPNPNMTFPLLLGAALCTMHALTVRTETRWTAFVAAGALGGLLCYCYTFYAVAWGAACVLLMLLSFSKKTGISRKIAVTFGVDAMMAVPFLLWEHVSRQSGAFLRRTLRMGLTYSHWPSLNAARLTLIYGLVTLVAAGVGLWKLRRREDMRERLSPEQLSFARNSILVSACIVLGALAGMNMQMLTGFNVQPESHYPHMVVQPMILVLLAILFVLLRRPTAESRGYGRILIWALLLLVAGASVATQVSAAVNSAPFHRVNPSDRTLFQWLGQHTTPGDVVATVNLRICMDLPVFTHNNTLLVEGSRTSASNEEILERFLLANALTGTPVSRVAAELREQESGPHALPIVTYSFMLFEQSPYMNPATHSMYEAETQELLTQYRNLQLPAELNRYRVDYVYAPMDQHPPQIAGWRLTEVLTTGDGRLWRIERA